MGVIPLPYSPGSHAASGAAVGSVFGLERLDIVRHSVTPAHVTVAAENQTLASITFQNYFRLYEKLSGMTGTADTEAVEFHQIYNLEVISIPPNKPMIRKDYPDLIYRTRQEKFDAIVQAIVELHKKEQPVLVGTISIETSEMLSHRLTKLGIPHSVLNAKQHEKEAEIVAQAGQKGRVTIATNMPSL